MSNTQATGVKATVLNKAVAMLSAIKAEFVIKTEDGEYIKMGNLEVQEPKTRKRRSEFPHGTYKNYVESFGFSAMQVGDVIVVPKGVFDAETVRGSLSSRACKMWGNGSAVTSIVGDVIEILRVS
jgi:hypothetical protein|tara:strand:+ start:101 stop:475 length:375 start_codon:yes stop_codon:yes gene_type:complete